MDTHREGSDSVLHKKKKRERRKKCRAKPWKSEETELKSLSEEAAWKSPTAVDILHKSLQRPFNKDQLINLNQGNCSAVADELLGKGCCAFLRQRKADYVDRAEKFATQMITHFKKFRVRRALNDHVPRLRGQPPKELIKHTVTIGQFRAFFLKAMKLVFPVELFGNENFALLHRHLCRRLFHVRRRDEVVVFEELAAGIRYKNVEWMGGIPFRYQDLIMRSLCRYVLDFALNAMSFCFYGTVNANGEAVYYRRDNWYAIERHGFEALTLERRLQPLPQPSAPLNDGAPLHRLRFHAKESSGGLRPIVTYRDRKAARELVPVKAVLDLVMDENKKRLGMGVKSLKTFHAQYRQMVLSERKKPSAERYWCSADLSNCFTAMNHATLERILCELIPSNKVYTVVSVWVRNRIAKRNYRKHAAGASYSGAKARFRHKHYEDADTLGDIKKITGGEVLALIRKHAMRTVISHSHRKFVCNRGIPQGNPLSVKLCNLYLGAMEHALFPNPPRNITCVRYVDDYFLTSTDKQTISEVVEKLFEGDRLFETRFNDKAKTSFACKNMAPSALLRPNEKLKFCGYAINRKTLSVTVDYPRYRQKRPSYVPPRAIEGPDAARQLICNTVKRLTASRFRQFRRCYQLFRDHHRRRQLRQGFLRFVSDHYLQHFAREMQLRWRDRPTREFFAQVLRWVGQNFRAKAAPTGTPALRK